MVIAVLSCDKNADTFPLFHYCMETYWPNHPKVIYYTDGIINPFYYTIPVPHELTEWTRGLRDFLWCLEDEQILLMIDDCFIRRPVDEHRIDVAQIIMALEDNLACLNFEKSWDAQDEPTEYNGWKKRRHGSEYEVSLMCGLWNKDKLIKVLERDCDPWTIELEQQPCGFDYYINSGDYIIDWGYKTFKPCNIVKGKWTKECIDFFHSQGIEVDTSQKGIL